MIGNTARPVAMLKRKTPPTEADEVLFQPAPLNVMKSSLSQCDAGKYNKPLLGSAQENPHQPESDEGANALVEIKKQQKRYFREA